MDVLTLRFEDEVHERDLRAGAVHAANFVVILFGVFNLGLNWQAGMMSAWPAVVSLFVTYTCAAVAMRRAPTPSSAHALAANFWTGGWVVNVAIYWMLVRQGYLQRLAPTEGRRAAASCGIWLLSTLLQHMVHIGAAHRFVVLGLAMTIVLTSVAWRKELMLSLVAGEALGYAVEHMLRTAFLKRANALEQVRREKERVAYEYAILEHRTSRECSRSPARAGMSGRRSSGRSAGGSSGSASSAGSELSSYASRDSKQSRLPPSRNLPPSLRLRPNAGPSPHAPASSAWSDGEEEDDALINQERSAALWSTLEASNLLPPSAGTRSGSAR